MRVYIDSSERLAALAISGIQATCQQGGSEWSDLLFEQRDNTEERVRAAYASDLRCGLRFYIETE